MPMEKQREAKQEFLETLITKPNVIVERMTWLFNGTYGDGYQIIANSYFNRSKRFNIQDRLLELIAIAEYRCPSRQARQAYNSLTEIQKALFNLMVNRIIKNHHTTKGE